MKTTRTHRTTARALLGLVAVPVAMIALIQSSNPVRAELVPCDPFECPSGPVYAPEQIAIGVHRDIARAQTRAEDQAAATCSYDHTFDVVRVRPTERADGKWEYKLTYRCNSPAYDPWP